MADDDVLRGVRVAREAFAQTHGFDPHSMVAALRELDAAGDWPVVPLGPQPAVAGSASEHRPELSPSANR